LHTNGYSLARKIIFEKAGLKIKSRFPGTKRSVADVLLAVHRSYLKYVRTLLRTGILHGIAHITGGGLPDNVARIMPKGLSAVFDCSSWRVPAVFRFLQEQGRIDAGEMYRVFNMGIGMILVVSKHDLRRASGIIRKAGTKPLVIGHIEKGSQPVTSLPTSL
jgi:phosphoribosylformylglycinamidine cyclo-ligase